MQSSLDFFSSLSNMAPPRSLSSAPTPKPQTGLAAQPPRLPTVCSRSLDLLAHCRSSPQEVWALSVPFDWVPKQRMYCVSASVRFRQRTPCLSSHRDESSAILIGSVMTRPKIAPCIYLVSEEAACRGCHPCRRCVSSTLFCGFYFILTDITFIFVLDI